MEIFICSCMSIGKAYLTIHFVMRLTPQEDWIKSFAYFATCESSLFSSLRAARDRVCDRKATFLSRTAVPSEEGRREPRQRLYSQVMHFEGVICFTNC